MLLKDSRYLKPQQVQRFDADDESNEVFEGIRPRTIGAATGVVEHVVEKGQRLDALAHHYYNDSRLWWRILDANPDLLFGGELLLDEFAGETLLIPKAKE